MNFGKSASLCFERPSAFSATFWLRRVNNKATAL